MPDEMMKADPVYRKRLFIGYGLALVLLAALIIFVLPPVLKYLNSCAIPKFLNLTEIIVLVFLLAFIAPALFLIQIGRKILRYKQVPYPGMKVIHDTKIVVGKKAAFWGNLLVILGLFSIILALAGCISSHYFFEKFRHFSPFHSTVRVAAVISSDIPGRKDYVYLSQ